MTKSPRAVFTLFFVVLALALPELAQAQARNRGRSGGQSHAATASAKSARPPAPAHVMRPIRQAPQAPGPNTTVSRTGPAKSSRVSPSVSPSRVPGRSGDTRANSDASLIGAAVPGSRDRGSWPAVGTAVPRRLDGGGRTFYVSIPVYTGWGWWSPWYGFGYSRFYGFGPYAPFGYYGYGPSYGTYEGYLSGIAGPVSEPGSTGSVRFEVSPDTASIYIDGALAGTASDFQGLTEHLDLAAGGYRLEIRAVGYQTYAADILVKAGTTMTERVKLKK